MKTYRTTEVLRPDTIVCDVCGMQYSYTHDIFEAQEFISIDFVAGFGSVFGDGNKVNLDMCQHCASRLLGKHLQVDKTDRITEEDFCANS